MGSVDWVSILFVAALSVLALAFGLHCVVLRCDDNRPRERAPRKESS